MGSHPVLRDTMVLPGLLMAESIIIDWVVAALRFYIVAIELLCFL